MELVIRISFGNERMQSLADASDAVHMDLPYRGTPVQAGESGTITDENGNAVGVWEVKA